MTTSTYQVWGWGRADSDEPKQAELEQLAPLVRDHLGLPVQGPEQPAPLADLPADRVSTRLPAALAGIASSAPLDRAAHSIGRSYRDIVRGVRGRLDHVVDVVLRPTDESQIAAALDWCGGARVAVIPYSGGSSVVGGVEPRMAVEWSGVVSLDRGAMPAVAEAGAGPAPTPAWSPARLTTAPGRADRRRHRHRWPRAHTPANATVECRR